MRPMLASSLSTSSFGSASGSGPASSLSSPALARGVNGMSLGPGPSSYINGQGSSNNNVGGSWIREGPVSTKEDGLRSMFFGKRYAILRESALTFHKSKEVSP